MPGVLIVDHSPFMRRVLRDLIERAPDFTVVGEAAEGSEALAKVHALAPDVVTLDVEMPGVNGLAALAAIMREAPRPVVMLSALDDGVGADLTVRALELGAVDFVRKPARDTMLDLQTLGVRLLSALRAALAASGGFAPVRPEAPHRPPVLRADRRAAAPPAHAAQRVVVIAASTGGPRALAEIVAMLPPALEAAVVIVQHMPAGFTRSLARRLDELAAVPVIEAADGDALGMGTVYVAPGGRHLTLTRDLEGTPRLAVHDAPPIRGLRPSADPLLESAAREFGGRAVAVVLTGMGDDGAAGVAAVRGAGGYALVQDRDSCTVYGMPQATLARAGADRVVALREMAGAIVTALGGEGRGSSPAGEPSSITVSVTPRTLRRSIR